MKHLLFALAALMMVNLEAETVKNHSHLSGLPPFRNGTAPWTRISFEQAMSSKGVFFRGSAALRSAMLNNRKFFGLPAVEMRASYNAQNKLTRIDIIYANKGDSANLKKMSRTISRSAKELAATLTKLFGPEKRKNYGMKNMQNRVSGWDGGNAEILLDFIRSEYVILHIEMTDSTVQEEKKEDSGKDVKDKDFSQCVKTNRLTLKVFNHNFKHLSVNCIKTNVVDIHFFKCMVCDFCIDFSIIQNISKVTHTL